MQKWQHTENQMIKKMHKGYYQNVIWRKNKNGKI